ncbi:SUMF1/EgtB/PvdO family nonheme iron enzyme [Roseovarius salinarum]|uniref:SUMF1/EgtB/PvdO family nonheme iron enzyme n=1 Tax=Roseovarius salinarum TaxID=1981892 RepID=UPI000D528C06|nr:SUMF1/EgtB/PvdO family nonheme iron enzyme [Roseovarius salinarum]
MRVLFRGALFGALMAVMAPPAPGAAATLQENNDKMLRQMQAARNLSNAEMRRIREVFAGSRFIGQGNPAITRHPMTPQEAAKRVPGDPLKYYRNSRFERICGERYMVPLYDPATEQPEDAEVCADMFEYPNVPMVYPVVWVRAKEAAELCWAEGKRIGDAHEWEGASHGALTDPDYFFGMSVQAARQRHNAKYRSSARYSIGKQWRAGVCATGSFKNASCNGGGYNGCGSNTYPAGSFPKCRSPLGVYDIDGNAAEHMNLPMAPDEMASRGSRKLGVTEMKGSWFIWDTVRAHTHWSRWRAPFWHGSRVMAGHSHRNYHLGFRCFKDVK